jgi:hypothetical protein
VYDERDRDDDLMRDLDLPRGDLATGQHTKQEVIARATAAGLRSRKGLTLSPQSFGQMMRNPNVNATSCVKS